MPCVQVGPARLVILDVRPDGVIDYMVEADVQDHWGRRARPGAVCVVQRGLTSDGPAELAAHVRILYGWRDCALLYATAAEYCDVYLDRRAQAGYVETRPAAAIALMAAGLVWPALAWVWAHGLVDVALRTVGVV